jgi:hypothetical protein
MSNNFRKFQKLKQDFFNTISRTFKHFNALNFCFQIQRHSSFVRTLPMKTQRLVVNQKNNKIYRIPNYLHGCLCVLFILYILVGVCASYIIFLISIEFKASYNVEIFKYINILPVNKNILLVWRILVHLRA